MTPLKALEAAITHFADASGRRGVPGLAKATGFGITRIDNMRSRRRANPNKPLPANWGLQIELATNGRVRREQLCPDVDWKGLMGRK